MWLRPHAEDPHRPHEHVDQQPGNPARTSTTLDPSSIPLDDDGYRFLLQLELRGISTLWRGAAYDPVSRADRDAVIAAAADGSRAEAFTAATDGRYPILQTGPRRLWPAIEAAHRLWLDLDRPNPERFGVVATGDRNFVWLDHDHSWHRWPLPLV